MLLKRVITRTDTSFGIIHICLVSSVYECIVCYIFWWHCHWEPKSHLTQLYISNVCIMYICTKESGRNIYETILQINVD